MLVLVSVSGPHVVSVLSSEEQERKPGESSHPGTTG
jgi:hypothetical protein